jgi:DNA-binding MarR family transcriptional regulator
MQENPVVDWRVATFRQQELLRHLSRNNGRTVGQISNLLGISSTATTKLVDRLERKQLVTRITDKMDRRRVLIHLTPLGLSSANEQ